MSKTIGSSDRAGYTREFATVSRGPFGEVVIASPVVPTSTGGVAGAVVSSVIVGVPIGYDAIAPSFVTHPTGNLA